MVCCLFRLFGFYEFLFPNVNRHIAIERAMFALVVVKAHKSLDFQFGLFDVIKACDV